MEQRPKTSLLAGVVAISLIAIVVIGVSWYPPLDESHPAGDADDIFTTPDAESYTATGAIYADGELFIAFESQITADGAQYYRTDARNTTVERYAPADQDGIVYNRYDLQTDEAGENTIERIEDDDDETLVVMENRADGDHYRVLTVENESHRHVDRGGSLRQSARSASSLVVVNAIRTQYHEVEPGPDETFDGRVFEPVDGWYDAAPPYRITAADGVVEVASDSYEVRHVNVTYTYTRNTPSYLEYVRNRDDSASFRFELDFDDESPDVTEPDWVSELEDHHQPGE